MLAVISRSSGVSVAWLPVIGAFDMDCGCMKRPAVEEELTAESDIQLLVVCCAIKRVCVL